MGSKETIAMRENKKIMMIEHIAFCDVIDMIDPRLYGTFSVNNGAGAIEDLIHIYKRLIEQCETLFAQTGDKVSFIDKAVCFAMAMKRKPMFIVSSEGKKSKVLKNANERAMAEALLAYLTCSEYKMLDHHKKLVFKNRFDLENFGEGHKRELNEFKKQLIEECSKAVIDYEPMVELLNAIYLKGVMYGEEIDPDLEDKVKQKLAATELYEVPTIQKELKPEYQLHKSKYRSMK